MLRKSLYAVVYASAITSIFTVISILGACTIARLLKRWVKFVRVNRVSAVVRVITLNVRKFCSHKFVRILKKFGCNGEFSHSRGLIVFT